MAAETRQKIQIMGTDGAAPLEIAVCNSGELKICSGIHVVADVDVVVSSGLWVDGISGIHVTANFASGISSMSGAEIIWRGIQVSGTVSFSGSFSGQWVEAHILSGNVVIISGAVGTVGAGTIRVDPIAVITADSGGQIIATSGPTHNMIIKSLSGNADIFVGGITSRPYSGYGFLLTAAELITIDIKDTGLVYACANTSGNRLTYIATDY